MSETPSHYGKKLQGIFTLDENAAVTSGLYFVRGFLDLLFYAADSEDGLQCINIDGLQALIGEARHQLEIITELLEKLNNPQGEEPI